MKDSIDQLKKIPKIVTIATAMIMVAIFVVTYFFTRELPMSVFFGVPLIWLAQNQLKLLNRIDDLELDKPGNEKLLDRVDELEAGQPG